MKNKFIQVGITRFMWKSALLYIIILYIIVSIIKNIVVISYNKLIKTYKTADKVQVKLKATRLLKISNLLSIGPGNKNLYAVYNGLCSFLALMSLVDRNENEFLCYLKKVKKENSFGTKFFLLALYYRAKGMDDLAHQHYEKFLHVEYNSEEFFVIMNGIFNDKKDDQFYEVIKKTQNPGVLILLEQNNLR